MNIYCSKCKKEFEIEKDMGTEVYIFSCGCAELAALEAERDEWKKRAEQAAHIKEGDAVGFDWNVLTQIESLEAVAEAARTGRGLDDALDALDALKGAE